MAHPPVDPTLAERPQGPPAPGRRNALALLAAALGGTLGLGGCGGGIDLRDARVRLVNASVAYPALDLVIDDRLVRGNVAYGASADYAGVDTADTATRISRAGSPAALVSLRPELAEGDRYSIVAFGGEGALRAVVLDDDATEPDPGKARLRVLNGAPDAGAVDVYLTAPGVDLADAEPLHAAAAVGTATAFATLDAADWRLRVTAAGDRADLRLDLSGVAFGSRQIATLVITHGAGGVLVNALVLTQGGAVLALAGAQARVRVVAGVTDSGNVTAAVGSVALMNGVGAPAIGLYRLVPSGPAAATVTVDGFALAVPPAELAPGSDHTLLVRGSAAAPVAHWIADDNRLPSVAGRVKLRLLNGLADLAAPLALTLDFTPLADGVAAGTASPPVLTDASTQARLSVTAAGVGAPLFDAVDQLLLADRVHTLFVLGSAAAPAGILYRDR